MLLQVVNKVFQLLSGFVYTPLNWVNADILEEYLVNYPDRREVHYVVDGFCNGFELGLTSFPESRGPCDNYEMVQNHLAEAQALVDKGVAMGHVLGPFDKPPLPDMVFSPFNLIPKANSLGSYHLIYDLSFPYSDQSINNCIPEEHATVEYHFIDELIDLALQLGKNIWGVSLDISHAYCNLPLRFSQLRLMGFSLNGKFFINCTLPFGASSSFKIFEQVNSILEWIICNETSWKWISHFLDDYPMLGPTREALLKQIEKFLAIMQRIGLPITHEKTLGPTQQLPYLGLLLNLVEHLLEIPDDKRVKNIARIDHLLTAFQNRKSVTVKDIQKVAGSLNFICSAIPAGKPFLCALHQLTRSCHGKRICSGHHRRISREVYEDLSMFCTFLVECAEKKYHSIPFPIKLNIFNSDIQLFADSNGSAENGFGCWFQNSWSYGLWRNTTIFNQGCIPNITLLELYAIVMAVELWVPRLSSQCITLRSNNSSTCDYITSMKSNIPACQQLFCHFTLTCLHFQIYIKAEWLEGSKNVWSDLLSHRQISQFLQKHLTANPHPDPLPSSLWPPTWTLQDMQSIRPKKPKQPHSQKCSLKASEPYSPLESTTQKNL